MRCIEAGWAPEDARGRYLGKNYLSLARLKKYDLNPYEKDDPRFSKRKDGEGHLHEAWRHLKRPLGCFTHTEPRVLFKGVLENLRRSFLKLLVSVEISFYCVTPNRSIRR